MRIFSAFRWFLSVWFLCAQAAPANATLGQSQDSVESDRLAMGVAAPAVVNHGGTSGLSVHEMTLPTGTVVRQYVNPKGVVAAVAWIGPYKPDLKQLMGANFEAMVALSASRTPYAGRSQLTVREGDLVAFSGGHVRNFFGRAYLKSELPSGVAPESLQ